MTKPSTETLKVRAEGGFVLIDGPRGVIATLTPAAAIRSGDALHEAGAAANGQIGAEPSIASNLD